MTATLRELAQTATPGEWTPWYDTHRRAWALYAPGSDGRNGIDVLDTEADALFIAACHNELCDLLDQLAAAQEALRLADAALLYANQGMTVVAGLETSWQPYLDAVAAALARRGDDWAAAARARQEEP